MSIPIESPSNMNPSLGKGILCAVGFALLGILCAYSIWAEWGPYAWVASLQLALFSSYLSFVTFALTLLLFGIPALLLGVNLVEQPRAIQALAFGIPALLVLCHFLVISYCMIAGGSEPTRLTVTEAIQRASILPQGISVESKNLFGSDFGTPIQLTSRGRGGTTQDGLFLPIMGSAANPDTQVFLKTSDFRLKYPPKDGEMVNLTVSRAPIPFLVRNGLKTSGSAMGIILDEGTSVRMSCLAPAIMYLVGIFYGLRELWGRRRKAA